MQNKKSDNANLENKRFTFFQIGLILSLSLSLIAFECINISSNLDIVFEKPATEEDEEMTHITRTEVKKPEPLKPKQIIPVIEKIVPNSFDVDFDPTDYLSEDSELDFNPYNFEDEETIDEYDFYKVEVKPSFPGGFDKFSEYVYNHIIYPEEAIENNIQGIVYIEFIINEKGELVEPELIRSAHPILDKEVFRVLKLIPKWQPGMQTNNAVRVRYKIPVKFKLN